jgi:multisubunit Na+/H+ antiporter MnhB subunit
MANKKDYTTMYLFWIGVLACIGGFTLLLVGLISTIHTELMTGRTSTSSTIIFGFLVMGIGLLMTVPKLIKLSAL